MPEKPNHKGQFWQELKDRKVVRTATVYVAVAFGLLELIDIISGPLSLPGWVLTVFIFIAAFGLPVSLLLSWLYYLGPEGIKRYRILPSGIPGNTSGMEEMLVVDEESVQSQVGNSSKKNSGKIYGISSVLVLILVAVFFLFYSGKSAPFNERDWVVLADFVNYTEEIIFDHSLNTAFEISINQSRHINVITRKRAKEALKRIGTDEETIIDEELSREIAIREGAKAYIVPEISSVGNQYILSAKLMETKSGRMVASELYYSKAREEILNKLDRLSKKMRRHLGESRYKISGQSKPLEQVTTSSIEALKEYSLGVESHIAMDFHSARSFYENAIRLDSSFTAAKASLGNILYEHFDRGQGKKWLDEAILSIDNLTDRERFSILAFYAANEEKDLDKSIEYIRILLDLYPDMPMVRNNLGWYLQNKGEYKESIEQYKKTISLDPYLMIPYAGLISNYIRYLGQVDSALIWSKRMISADPKNGYGYLYMGSCYFALDQVENAAREFEKARELAPRDFLILYRLAHSYRVLEKYGDAVEVLNEIGRIDKQQSPVYYNLGLCYEKMERDQSAKENYLIYKSFTENWEKRFPDSPSTWLSKGTVMTRLGEIEEGFIIGKKGIDLDTSNHFNIARFLAVQDRKEEALDHLELALAQGYRQIVWIKMEPDISLLKEEKRYKDLIDEYFNLN